MQLFLVMLLLVGCVPTVWVCLDGPLTPTAKLDVDAGILGDVKISFWVLFKNDRGGCLCSKVCHWYMAQRWAAAYSLAYELQLASDLCFVYYCRV